MYAIFTSKTGILIELLDDSAFGGDYVDLVRQALSASDPETRLRFAARIARQIHEAQSTTFDLLRGAGVLVPLSFKMSHVLSVDVMFSQSSAGSPSAVTTTSILPS